MTRSEMSPVPPSIEEVEREEELAELAEAEAEAEEEMGDPQDGSLQSSEGPKSYRTFIQTIGQQFKYSSPQNWLGKDIPFPMNKSFRPPPPISDAQKNLMYNQYMADPIINSVRALSQRYHISLKRVDAILRLKGMEAAWVEEKKQLQTGFLKGMERLLAVQEFRSDSFARMDVREADTSEEVEQRDAARQRYQRMYWESVAEHGGEPIVPAAIEHSKKLAERLTEKARLLKEKNYLPKIPDTDTIKTPKQRVQVSEKEGRPSIHFIDVGTKFLDVVAESKRLARIEARAKHRAKKAEEKKLLLAQ